MNSFSSTFSPAGRPKVQNISKIGCLSPQNSVAVLSGYLEESSNINAVDDFGSLCVRFKYALIHTLNKHLNWSPNTLPVPPLQNSFFSVFVGSRL